MQWVAIAAWCAAALVAVVVLGFCAYELSWKARRLQRDLGRLQGLTEQLAVLQGQVGEAQQRIAASGLG